jgi:hypothetical protein
MVLAFSLPTPPVTLTELLVSCTQLALSRISPAGRGGIDWRSGAPQRLRPRRAPAGWPRTCAARREAAVVPHRRDALPVPSPRHKYPDQNPDLTEISLRF